ncbi:MAG TPA: sigma-54 dependent transcriptional regulator [Gemmatimonadaceae bacterium]|jgi:DNA-binding NtrC family response regulator
MNTLLIVDDVRALADQFAYDLRRLTSMETLVATDGDAALEILAREPVDCVILDLEMPGRDGFGVLRAMRERGLDVPVVVYTGTGNYDRCVQALRAGAYGFIDKGETVERVAREVESAIERRLLLAEVATLRTYAAEDSALLGDSPAMRRLKESITRVAPIPSTVLIIGESGSGKELVARDVHRLSGREREPFVALNCAAIPEQLVESELFGHERGAFTGAHATRKGAFEAAGKGTLFLDEIGELPLAAQAKLLRALEERQIVRVGASRPIPFAARIIAATNRELHQEVAERRFREDLLFRLDVHALRVPPLRERRSDIPQLVDHLVRTTCERFGIRRKAISAAAVERLSACDWKRNNVRELRNVIERMVIACDDDAIGEEHIPAEVHGSDSRVAPDPASSTFVELKAEAERQIVVAALQRHDWHVTRTARSLGLADHASLLKIMRRHGLRRES